MLDLTPGQLEIVKAILAAHLPGREVRAFGSRVHGGAGEFSDLDLVVVTDTPLDFGLLGRLRDAFSESDLPFKVDVLDWATTSPDFRARIDELCEVVQSG